MICCSTAATTRPCARSRDRCAWSSPEPVRDPIRAGDLAPCHIAQAFADNPQKVVDHAGWLAEQLHAAEQLSAAQKRRGGSSSRVDGSSSWSDVNVKVEVLRLFANLLPDQLQSPEGALVVDSTLCTLNALAAAPPSPSPSRQKTKAPPGSDAPSPAELRADLVTFAKQILHKAPRITLEPLAKKLVDLALQPEDPELHAEGRQLLQKLGVKQRQEAAKAMLDILKEAPAPAGPTKSEPFTSLLTALAHDNPTVLSPHVDTLMELAASESKLAASVAAETLPGMAQDANIFGQLVKQVEAKDVDPDKVRHRRPHPPKSAAPPSPRLRPSARWSMRSRSSASSTPRSSRATTRRSSSSAAACGTRIARSSCCSRTRSSARRAGQGRCSRRSS